MVANIRSGSSPEGALYYNKEKVDKNEAEVLLWQKMLEPFDKYGRMDVDACMESFRPYLEANRRTTNTVFHASLNPSPEDKLTDGQLRDIAQEYMERMGYGNQPYIVFKHKGISREHLHIVSLRVDEQGRKINDSHEYDRSMSVLRELERKYDLHLSIKGEELADKVRLHKVNYREGNVKQQISFVVRSCLRNYKCSSYGEFRTLLERFNVSVEERTGIVDGRNYAGVIYGALTDDGYGTGTPFKSSKIGKDVGYNALQKYYGKSKAALKEEGALDCLRQTVRDAMSPRNTRDEFRQMLKADGIDTIFRRGNVHRSRSRHRRQWFGAGKGVFGQRFQRVVSVIPDGRTVYRRAVSGTAARTTKTRGKFSLRNCRYGIGSGRCAGLWRTATADATISKEEVASFLI